MATRAISRIVQPTGLLARPALAALLAVIVALLVAQPVSAGAGNWTLVTRDTKDVYAVDPSNPSVLIAGSAEGLYRSVNGGTSWARLVKLASGDYWIGVVFDPLTPSIVYALPSNVRGCGDGENCSGNLDQTQDPGLYQSRDHGKSWKRILGGLVTGVDVDPQDSRIVYARVQASDPSGSSSNSLRRSADAGRTWATVISEPIDRVIVSPGDPRVVYAIGESKGIPQVHTSVDRGRTWKVETSGTLINFAINFGTFASSPKDPSILLSATGADSGRLLRSADRGRTWVEAKVPEGPQTKWVDVTPVFDAGGAAYVTVNYLDSGQQSVESRILRSTDGGATWSVALSLPQGDLRWSSILANPANPDQVIFATDRAFVYETEDGGKTFARLELPGVSGDVRLVSSTRSGTQMLYAKTDSGLWAYTLQAKAGALPRTGDPLPSLLPLAAGLGAALAVLGLRLRTVWFGECRSRWIPTLRRDLTENGR